MEPQPDNDSPLTCVECGGKGVLIGMFPRYAPGYQGPRKPYVELTCNRCNGSGQMPAIHVEWMKTGDEMKRERLSRHMGLRAEAERRGISPSVLSKMENGILEPVRPLKPTTVLNTPNQEIR